MLYSVAAVAATGSDFKLAAKIADAVETLDKISCDLKIVQIETEEMYISDNEQDKQQITSMNKAIIITFS